MAKNNLLSEQLAYIGVSCTPTHLHLCSYNAESICMKDGKDIDSLIPYLNKNAINWIQIHGFQNTEVIQHVCQNFNVDFLTIQDILNSDHQTKIEQHDTYNVVILKLLFSNDDGYVPQQIAIVQGGNYLLTFMEKETDFLNDINTALEKNVLIILSRQSDFLLSVILNSVMASFISIISELEDGLEDLEEQLLSPEQADMLGIENQPRIGNFCVCFLVICAPLLDTEGLDICWRGYRHTSKASPYLWLSLRTPPVRPALCVQISQSYLRNHSLWVQGECKILI